MIRVFIVDDHPLVVEGIHASLKNESEFYWSGHAANAEQCLQYFKTNSCDVILMDISLPDKSGIDLCREMKQKYPGIQILGLSTFHQGSYVAKMLESGATGYVVKNANKSELIEAIRQVAAGKTYMSFEAGQALQMKQEKDKELPILTRREKEVLKLITDGLTNPQIAKELFISTDTVDSHRKNLLAKLKVNNTAALVRFAFENSML
jgi:DNA-binding NarL/FixJ family response regulator